jgi:hypothetical protein
MFIPLYLGERVPEAQWIGDWVSLRAGLEVAAKIKIPALAGNREPVVHLLASESQSV